MLGAPRHFDDLKPILQQPKGRQSSSRELARQLTAVGNTESCTRVGDGDRLPQLGEQFRQRTHPNTELQPMHLDFVVTVCAGVKQQAFLRRLQIAPLDSPLKTKVLNT